MINDHNDNDHNDNMINDHNDNGSLHLHNRQMINSTYNELLVADLTIAKINVICCSINVTTATNR